VFRKEFDLFASPVAVEYRTEANPYARGRPRTARSRTEKVPGRRARD
jgi:hypothetical protein